MRSVIFLTCFCAAGAIFAQTGQPIDRPSAQEALGSPSFTDKDRYNSYDFCGSPLGIFKKDSVRVRLDLGMRGTWWHERDHGDSLKRSALAWNLPDLLIGKPGIMYVRINYTPTSISDNTRDFTSGAPGLQNLSLPLQRFGLLIAGQTPSGIFQMALRGKGYYGDEALEGSQNARLIMGLEDLSATIGSRIHELVTIGMQGGAIGKLDTLRDYRNPTVHDRYFVGKIPMLGWYVDFGKPGFPFASDFSLQIATHRFVYVTRNDEDRAPIRGDSLALKWQAIGDIAHGGITYHPALCLGYWSNHYQIFQPTADNNSLDVGPDSAGRDWKISDLRLGIGTSIEFGKFGSARLEYEHSSMSLDYGADWSILPSRQKGYDRVMIGVEGSARAITAIQLPPSMEMFVRLGYFNQRENSAIGAFESEQFELVNSVDYNSMMYRYTPDFGWGSDQRVIGFTVGLGGSFFNRLLSADAHVALLSRTGAASISGTQFGVDCVYSLR